MAHPQLTDDVISMAFAASVLKADTIYPLAS